MNYGFMYLIKILLLVKVFPMYESGYYAVRPRMVHNRAPKKIENMESPQGRGINPSLNKIEVIVRKILEK